MEVRVYGLDQLDSVSTERWSRLADASISINPFYEPWHLLPALRRFADPDVSLVCVEDRNELLALLPVFPIKTAIFNGLKSWKHRHSFLNTPLFRTHEAVEVLIRGALAHHDADFFNLDQYGGTIQGISDGPYNTTGQERACQDLTIGWDEFLARRKKRRRGEYLRILRKADENGFVYSESKAGDSAEDWLEEFMELEARGWKGSKESAIASDDNVKDYYLDVIGKAWPMGKMQFQKISSDGKPIAVSFRYVCRGTCFEVKTCFDEDLRQLSPGVVLELRNLESLFASANVFADTCAAPDNTMLNRMWLDRLSISSTLMFSSTLRGKVAKLSYGSWRDRKYRERAAS